MIRLFSAWWMRLTVSGKSLALVLLLLPIAMFLGHWWTGGAIWNHMTHTPFSPWKNYVSDYAYRSPVWPIFVGCMYAFAIILVGFSLKLFHWSGRWRFLAWLLCLSLGYSGLKLVEVAISPVKSPEVTIEELQSRMDPSLWKLLKDDAFMKWQKINGVPTPKQNTPSIVVEAFVSNAKHLIGIEPAMFAIAFSIVFCWILDPRTWLRDSRWRLSVTAFALVVVALPQFQIFSSYVGLGQRIGFLGVYIWMWQMLTAFFKREIAEKPVEVRNSVPH